MSYMSRTDFKVTGSSFGGDSLALSNVLNFIINNLDECTRHLKSRLSRYVFDNDR